MDPLRVGFIGAGIFSTWAIYPALYLADIDLKAVCDVDEEKAQEVAGKYGTTWYTDYRKMWEQEDLEAVIIWMRPRERQALVREALEAGLHVFTAKPPAPSLAETVELAELSSKTGKVCMVDFQRRFSFGVTNALEIMKKPSFGKLTQLSCSFCSGKYDSMRGVGYDDPIHAFLLDFSVHHMDLARHIGGDVEQASFYHNTLDDGGAFSVALQFENGAVGTLQLSSQRVWWRNYDRIEITGQNEYIVLDGIWSYKHYTQEQNTFWENYSDERSTELGGDGPALAEFVSAIREGREPIASIQDCVGTMRLYQAIWDAYTSGQSGPVKLER